MARENILSDGSEASSGTDTPLLPLVHIVDDDPLICKVLGAIVETGGWRPKVYGSAENFLASHQSSCPGCVLLDMHMPGMNGLDCLRELKKRDSALPVVMVTGHADVELAVKAMKEGALDFFEKPVTAARVLDVVRQAINLSLAENDLRANQAKRERLLAALTPRERQVLERICRGEINKAVGRRLGISEKTVEVHRARVMSKLNAKSLADLMRIVQVDSSTVQKTPSDVAEPVAKVLPLRTAGRREKSSGRA